jgi:hypothetical protein
MENTTETINGQHIELVRLGRIVATPGALAALNEANADGRTFLDRHARGDWGDVDECDCKENNTALRTGERLHSAYTLKTGAKLWVITEAGRSATTLLLPQEY